MINYTSPYLLNFLVLVIFQGYGRKYLVKLKDDTSNDIIQKTEERYFEYMNMKHGTIKKSCNSFRGR